MRTDMRSDGVFNINTGEKSGIYYMYPGIEERPIYSIKTETKGNIAVFEGEEIDIRRTTENKEDGSLDIKIDVLNQREKIHSLFAFYEAEVRGMEGIYQIAHGMGDETGYLSKEEIKDREEVQSYGIVSIKCPDRTITLFGTEHCYYRNIYRLRRKGEKFYLSCELEIENTKIENQKLPLIRVLIQGNMEEQLDYAAKAIGRTMHSRKIMPPAYHWCSWYYCYHNFDMNQLNEYLEGFESWKYSHDMKYFQIDAGYCVSLGDWLMPNERWRPGNLKAAFEKILSYGYIPGIWIGPFMVGNRSRLFAEHPDWILYDLNGNPVTPWIMDNEPKVWGYQDEEYYVLDTSHPEAMEYMRHVFRTLKSWGAGMFKTDFMIWGIQDSTKVKRYMPGKTSVEYFREFLQMIREEIGEESYWLGCIAPFLPFVGYADGMRIGGDVGSSWNGEFGPQNMIKSLTGNIFSNHDLFQIDPDAIMLRDFQIRLNETEIESLALLAAMSGGCIYTSDPLFKTDEKRKQLFHFIKPDKRRKPKMPFLSEARKEILLLHENRDTGNKLLYIFNPTDCDLMLCYDLHRIGLNNEMYIFPFREEQKIDIIGNKCYINVPAHGGNLYKATEKAAAYWNKDSLWKNLND